MQTDEHLISIVRGLQGLEKKNPGTTILSSEGLANFRFNMKRMETIDPAHHEVQVRLDACIKSECGL